MTVHLRPPLAFANALKSTAPRSSCNLRIRYVDNNDLSRSLASALSASFEDPSQLGAQVFEPVINIPALGSFLLIVVVFSLLQIRISQVNEAAVRRKEALTELRRIKSSELSSEGKDRPTSEQIQQALQCYETSLSNEESLRTIIPGIRIVAPNGPVSSSQEDIRAAKQFLGIDLSTDSTGNETRQEGFSFGAVAVLAIVALSQLCLLYMLSFDPMTANDVYTTIGGDPPMNMQLSSW